MKDMSDYTPEEWAQMTHEDRMAAIRNAPVFDDLGFFEGEWCGSD